MGSIAASRAFADGWHSRLLCAAMERQEGASVWPSVRCAGVPSCPRQDPCRRPLAAPVGEIMGTEKFRQNALIECSLLLSWNR
jgi:hypothetical protein